MGWGSSDAGAVARRRADRAARPGNSAFHWLEGELRDLRLETFPEAMRNIVSHVSKRLKSQW